MFRQFQTEIIKIKWFWTEHYPTEKPFGSLD